MRTVMAVTLCSGLCCPASAEGDIEYGAYLASECVTCHQSSDTDKGIPPITGWDPESFIAVLNAYKSKDRDNPAMQTIAGRLDQEQMKALAAYFASLGDQEN